MTTPARAHTPEARRTARLLHGRDDLTAAKGPPPPRAGLGAASPVVLLARRRFLACWLRLLGHDAPPAYFDHRHLTPTEEDTSCP